MIESQRIVDSVMRQMAERHGSSTRRDFEVACLTVEAADALTRVSQARADEETTT